MSAEIDRFLLIYLFMFGLIEQATAFGGHAPIYQYVDSPSRVRPPSYAERSIAGPIIYAAACRRAEDVVELACVSNGARRWRAGSREISLACRLNERINSFCYCKESEFENI